MRKIGVVTVSRSDYGIYLPILRRMERSRRLKPWLIVAGTHLSPRHGMTIRAIVRDGFRPAALVRTFLTSDTPEAVAQAMSRGLKGFAAAYRRLKPDMLLALGDRFEMCAAVAAAVPSRIPVAHLHGGESTEGAIDEAFRHAITKMSHLHFVSTRAYARRVIQMGEQPWRVIVSGAPGLDHLRNVSLLHPTAWEAEIGLRLSGPFLLVTYHPVTLEYDRTAHQMRELLAALRLSRLPALFTFPNADTRHRVIIRMIRDFVAQDSRHQCVANLGTQAYFSVMKYAAAMVGNSSSGIIEAASFGLPVVNIGTRQAGRIRGRNVIDVGYSRHEILAGIRKALSAPFRASLARLTNPYGDGHASARIVRTLERVRLDRGLLIKKFHDIA